MKKFFVLFTVCLCLAAFIAPSFAEDKIITAKIQSVVQAKDRNGNAYTRVIVEEPKELQGVKYVAGVPAMAFGATAGPASALKAGGILKAVVSEREFNGRSSYTILSIIQ
uniref:Uncharacterized protein n=1 Tax=viral metagenome TaxID=1070528 RepID=A0A6M3KXI9_9ZZZZ